VNTNLCSICGAEILPAGAVLRVAIASFNRAAPRNKAHNECSQCFIAAERLSSEYSTRTAQPSQPTSMPRQASTISPRACDAESWRVTAPRESGDLFERGGSS
jgi:hypothetical protein